MMRFKKLLQQRKFLILLIFILLSDSALQSAENTLTNLTQSSKNICSAYSGRSVERAGDPEGQKLTIEHLRSRMQDTPKESPFWSVWQEALAREVSGNDHPQMLLELGFQIKSVDGTEKMIPPESLLIPLEIYNRRVLAMISAGQLQESEAIFATLLFKPVEKSRPKILKARTYEEIWGERELKEGREAKTFRPGIDELPSAYDWRISGSRNPVSHYNWAEHIANGRMPVTFGQIYIHDLAHLTENLKIDPQTQRPEFMIAVRAIYREQKKAMGPHIIIKKPANKEQNKGPGRSLESVAGFLERRSFYILEYMSLGRLDSEARLRNLRPELFDSQTSLETLRQSLQRLSFEQLDARLKYWIENENQFVLNQGGGARDMIPRTGMSVNYLLDNLEAGADFEVFFREHLSGYLDNTKILLDYILRAEDLLSRWTIGIDESNPEAYMFSTYGQIEKLSQFRESLNTNAVELERFKARIADQLARFEMGLVKSVELKLTPAQLVYDLTGVYARPDSPSVKWLRSYLDPSGDRYYQFIE